MSYVVLARRYRPQTFDQLIGQEHVTTTLKNALIQGRQAHSYLFTGPRGVGKTSAARLLAKALRCENRSSDANPCGSCASCTEIQGGNSMDVIEIDAASNTGVDSIRELRENVSYMASEGHYRVYIIDEVHMLSTAAFNALLKTLEEPPPHVIFIFATTEIQKVPATIQSRCQRFDFKRIAYPVLMSTLKKICELEEIETDEASLSTISIESEGCLRDAQSLLDQAIALCGNKIDVQTLEEALGFVDRNAFFDLIQKIISYDSAQALKSCAHFHERGVAPKVLLSKLTNFFRELHYFFFTQEYSLQDEDFQKILRESAQKLQADEVIRAFNLCIQSQAQINSSLSASYLVESLVLKLALQRSSLSASVHTEPSQRPQNTPTPQRRAPEQKKPAQKIAPTAATPAPEIQMAPQQNSGPREISMEQLENYLRRQKPAWMPVLKSILELNKEGSDALRVRAKTDFAGKRLASSDGIQVLKAAFSLKQVSVELEESKGTDGPAKLSPQQVKQEKEKEAREHDAVKSALKIFDATLSSSKALD